MLLDYIALSSNCVVCIYSKTYPARFFFLVSLGGNDYPWEIVGMDFVSNLLTKSSEFHSTTIIDSFL